MQTLNTTSKKCVQNFSVFARVRVKVLCACFTIVLDAYLPVSLILSPVCYLWFSLFTVFAALYGAHYTGGQKQGQTLR